MNAQICTPGGQMRPRYATPLMVLFTVGTASCGGATNADQWDALVGQFLETYFEFNPTFAAYQGRHEFDGILPDMSEEGLRRNIDWLKFARAEVLAFDLESLDAQRRFEQGYVLSVIDNDLFWFEEAEWPWRNPNYYSLSPDVYLTREYAPLEDRMRAYVRWAQAVSTVTEQAKQNLRLPLPRSYIEIGRIRFGGLARYLEDDVPGVFASVTDSTLWAEFGPASAQAISALRDFDQWLEDQRPEQTEDFALGAETFLKMLWSTERVDVPLDRLEEIGREDLERNLAAMRQACAAYAPGQAVPECVDRVKGNKPEAGAVVGARNQLGMLEEFVRANELVSIPGTERALVDESPPHRRANFAYIDIPGPYEEGLPSIYYIAPPDPSCTPEEQAQYVPGVTDLLGVSVHEVWPGHFLQFLHANRSQSRFGQVFIGYAFAEGWAHYAEELVWESGLGDGDPEVHIGQLLNALLRNVRLISAIGLHTQGMSIEESERMFLEFAYQDPGNARQQAARGTYDPAYLNYTMGKLMIRKLREEWTAEVGGRDAWREFHDQFLSYGGPPIPLVREAMLGEGSGPPL